jgi:hypothetical protein
VTAIEPSSGETPTRVPFASSNRPLKSVEQIQYRFAVSSYRIPIALAISVADAGTSSVGLSVCPAGKTTTCPVSAEATAIAPEGPAAMPSG